MYFHGPTNLRQNGSSDGIRIKGLNSLPLWAESVFHGAGTVFIGVDMAPLDKMDPRRAKSAPGAIELNRHFGAETDLLNLQ